jgi:Ca2+-binding EF-hand superfamily protein
MSSQDILHAFRVFDRDDSGYITADNLRESLQTNEGEYIDQLIQEADIAGDGQISFREFRNLLVKNPLASPHAASKRKGETEALESSIQTKQDQYS